MSKIADNLRKFPDIERPRAIKVLHSCAEKVNTGIRPSTDDYDQCLSLIYDITKYQRCLNYIDTMEQTALNKILTHIFKYMQERSTKNDIKEVKELVQELIVLTSILHSRIELTEAGKQEKSIEETKEETKNV